MIGRSKLLRRQMSMLHPGVAAVVVICMVSLGLILLLSSRICSSPQRNGWDITFSVDWFDSVNDRPMAKWQ